MMLERNISRFFIVIFLLAFVSPVFAAGDLTLAQGSLATPSYINTKTITPMVNVTASAAVDVVNISGILVNITGIATNISNVFVYNDSDNDGVLDPTDPLLGSADVNITTNSSQVNFNSNFTIAAGATHYLIIALNVSPAAVSRNTTGINITSNESISAYPADITITNNFINSSLSQVQDVHASASISPNFVDTNVVNQSFTYTITPTGSDFFTNISIVLPTGYNVTNVTFISHSPGTLLNSTYKDSNLEYAWSATKIYINYSTGFTTSSVAITINFTANTNSTGIAADTFNSTMIGSNLTDVATDVVGTNTTVTTQQLFEVVLATAIKGAAYLNGSDYWEFSFSLNFTANVSGELQLKLSNWTNAEGTTNITLTNSAGNISYATLRNESSFASASKINVTYDYDMNSDGVPLNVNTLSNSYTVTLRMYIPSTLTVVSSSWWATYSMLFRSSP